MANNEKMQSRGRHINAEKGLYVRRDVIAGKSVSSHSNPKFKGISAEALSKLSPTLNRLAQYDKK